MLCKITIDVHAKWTTASPTYRIFFDNELITERDFGWPGDKVFVRELFYVEISRGVHRIEVHKVRGDGEITGSNVHLNDKQVGLKFIA